MSVLCVLPQRTSVPVRLVIVQRVLDLCVETLCPADAFAGLLHEQHFICSAQVAKSMQCNYKVAAAHACLTAPFKQP